MGYLRANFGLPRSLCSRLRPDVRDRQTDRRQTSDKSIIIIIIIIIIMFTKQGIGDALGIKIIIIIVVVVVVVVVVIGQIAPAVSAKLEGSDHTSCQ